MATENHAVRTYTYYQDVVEDVASANRISQYWPAMTMPSSEQIVALFQRLRQYVGWNEGDEERLRNAWPLVQPAIDSVVDDFYQAIRREPAVAKVITGGEAQIARLKGTLAAWIRELFLGPHDENYVVRRWKVGWRHVEIGLEQVYASAALCRLRIGLTAAVSQRWGEGAVDLSATLTALHRALDLDLALIENAYHTEFARRQQQMERLATLGQVAGGIAHELRNPLNVIETSVYYLTHAPDAPLQKRNEHLHRIARQVSRAEEVIAALSDFARLPQPERRPMVLSDCLKEVLTELALPTSIQVRVDIPPTLPVVHADRRQLSIVFRNILVNARDAVGPSGEIRVTASVEKNQVIVNISDNGCGIPWDVLPRVMEPLFTTKARGLGLGLAISRAILERHGARIGIASQPGWGTTVCISLPLSGTHP